MNFIYKIPGPSASIPRRVAPRTFQPSQSLPKNSVWIGRKACWYPLTYIISFPQYLTPLMESSTASGLSQNTARCKIFPASSFSSKRKKMCMNAECHHNSQMSAVHFLGNRRSSFFHMVPTVLYGTTLTGWYWGHPSHWEIGVHGRVHLHNGPNLTAVSGTRRVFH